GCSDHTTDIVLESAYFDPATIMGKSRDLGIHTESALRFERGVDPQLQDQAMQRATQLILEICGGQAGPITETSSQEHIPQLKSIDLSRQKLKQVLGFKVADQQVSDILKGLQMQVTSQADGWRVQAPSSRFDIAIEEDLVEEIVRLIGYDKMPAENLFGESVIMHLPENLISQNNIKMQLNNMGYIEAINYSFVSAKQLNAYGMQENSIALKNPLTEDFAIMRTSLLPGMMETLKYNLRRQNDSIKMFETGNVFYRDGGINEDEKIIAIMTGKKNIEHWGMDQDNVDFFDCKGDLENLLDNTKGSTVLQKSKHEFLHPGRQAQVILNAKAIGWIGQIHPEICRRIGIKKDVYAFELYIDNIMQTSLPSYQDISKFPSVRRDIAMIVDDTISYAQIKELISAQLQKYLVDVFVFDKYQGENIGTGKRSLAVGIVLQQKNSTFEDKDVDKLMSKVVSSIKQNLDVEIRGH
ncbi:MAG TPA: phenylalanine--tRNA ligase subunit beta, partial [Oceanospirillales bacterium]|nr:phenylalanine--tRNA ligase subunit beta [Oceanospirillales bacterium]